MTGRREARQGNFPADSKLLSAVDELGMPVYAAGMLVGIEPLHRPPKTEQPKEAIGSFGLDYIDAQLQAIATMEYPGKRRSYRQERFARKMIDLLVRQYMAYRGSPEFTGSEFGGTDLVSNALIKSLRKERSWRRARWVEDNPAAHVWANDKARL